MQAAVFTEARPVHKDVVESVTSPPSAVQDDPRKPTDDTIQTFFDAFNSRDLTRMADCVADDCEHSNLAYPSPFRGKGAVVEFYREFMNVVPPNATMVIEDTTGTGESGNVGAIWCVTCCRHLHSQCSCISKCNYVHTIRPLVIDPAAWRFLCVHFILHALYRCFRITRTR